MPTPILKDKIKRDLKLQVDLELLVLSITHEQKALNSILDKVKTMVRCFYSHRGNKLCKSKYLKVDKSYYKVEKAIENKKQILEYKLADILEFAERNNIDLCITSNMCNKKKNLFRL